MFLLISIYMYLQFVAAPILNGDNQMKDILVSTGENATFLCNVSSLPMELPPSPPKWKKNGVDLDIGGGCECFFFSFFFFLQKRSFILCLTILDRVSYNPIMKLGRIKDLHSSIFVSVLLCAIAVRIMKNNLHSSLLNIDFSLGWVYNLFQW